jgi:hypothetical protein
MTKTKLQLLLLLCNLSDSTVLSLVEVRKSILYPWKETANNMLGWAEEIRDREKKTLHVRLGWGEEDEEEGMTVKLPYSTLDEEDNSGLGGTLWPGGIAGAILCRSPSLTKCFDGAKVLELGCGLALAGLTAAANANTVVLTDNDEQVVKTLQETTSQENVLVELLEWRDAQEREEPFDVVLAMDVAYYYFLLRPLMDTVRSQMSCENSLWIAVGQANRECQWELYHNLKTGCYNQLTDEHDPAWPGTTQMLLYNLRMYEWTSVNETPTFDGDIPVAAMVHQTPGLILEPLTDYDHVATKEDEEGEFMSF